MSIQDWFFLQKVHVHGNSGWCSKGRCILQTKYRKKPENSRLWQAVSSPETKNNYFSRLTIVVIHRVIPVSLKQYFRKHHFSNLRFIQAFTTSTLVLTSPKAKFTWKTPNYTQFHRPTLVRTGQLAILRLQNYSQSIQLIVETFPGIEKRFRELLMKVS